MKLIAVLPILFESINYEPGDELPIHNIELTEIWTENGSAIWQENDMIKELAIKQNRQLLQEGSLVLPTLLWDQSRTW